MNFDVKIDCRALFNECVDQTLLDYRNRTTEAGQSMTATHTLELSLLDAFMFNLQSVAEALRARISKNVERLLFIPDLLLFRMRDILDMAPEATAIRIKDALKFGMLMWWYGGKDAPLFQSVPARNSSSSITKSFLEMRSMICEANLSVPTPNDHTGCYDYTGEQDYSVVMGQS